MDFNKGAYRVLNAGNYCSIDNEFYEIVPNIDTSGRTVTIGIADTGIINDAQFCNKNCSFCLTKGYLSSHRSNESEFIEKANLECLHGTYVAGQAAFGTKAIKLVNIKIQEIGFGNLGRESEIANTISAAITKNNLIKIISCSIFINWNKKEFVDLMNAHKGILFLTTAGNLDILYNEPIYGNEVDNALFVGGVGNDGTIVKERGYGDGVDVLVPSGPNIDVYDPDNKNGNFCINNDGVSFGVPIIANIAAKMLLINPELTPQQIKHILISEATIVDEKYSNRSKSKGIVDPVLAYRIAHDLIANEVAL